jgi:hypothetical protein
MNPSSYDFDPRNLPQEMLAAIGLVTACSAQTEYIVEQGIAGCLGVDFEFGAAVTTHMAAPLRDHVLRAVAEIKIDDLDDLDDSMSCWTVSIKHFLSVIPMYITHGAAIPIQATVSLSTLLRAGGSK